MEYTERSLRILQYAEREAQKTNQLVYPIHLLLGVLYERTGTCVELYIQEPRLAEIIKERVKQLQWKSEEDGIHCEPFTIPISQSTIVVLEKAMQRMNKFKQVYINEGHIVDALFKINDPLIRKITDALDISIILELVSYPRDMIVSLKNYSLPNMPSTYATFRRAEKSDSTPLKTFVEEEFGSGWLESIDFGLAQKTIPIFIASEENQIVGFACYDVVRKKKGLFGPMGTSISNRIQGIGYTLLHACLNEMKEIGYEYAVIGEAGPIEFYEKACNAVVIPRAKKNFCSQGAYQ